MNLIPFSNNGLELVINTDSGETFASISAVARMTDKPNQTILDYANKAVEQSRFEPLLTSKNLGTSGGKQSRLLNESQILEVVSKYKPDLLINFAQLGLRMYLHTMAGYKVQSTAVEIPKKLPSDRTLEEKINLAKDIAFLQGEIPEALRQVFLDQLGDECLSKLQIASSLERWLGCAQMAEQLGYKINSSNRVKLGTFCARANLEGKKEKRMCNGSMRSIWIYLESEALRNAIHDFFALENLRISS